MSKDLEIVFRILSDCNQFGDVMWRKMRALYQSKSGLRKAIFLLLKSSSK